MKFIKSISWTMTLLTLTFLSTGCEKQIEDISGTDENKITEDIIVNTTWEEDEYIIEGSISISSAILTIAPGTTIKFAEDACLHVSSGGGLIADGSTEKITFTGTEKEKGWWGSIVFENNASNANCRLLNCEIEYGGSEDYGMITIYNNATIENCVISNSSSDGIYVEAQKFPIMVNNTITDNAKSPVNIDFSNIGILNSASGSYSGNALDYISVRSSGNELTADATIRPMGIPFRFVGGSYWIRDAVLTILPGVTVEMSESTDLQARTGAGLIAVGTADSSITFTGVIEQKGYWNIIALNDDASNANCRLSHCVIEYGGDINGDENGDAILHIYNDATVQDCIIRESASYGVRFHVNAHPTFIDNTVTANAESPVIAVMNNASSAQRGSGSFSGNGEDYIFVYSYEDLAQNATWMNPGVPYRLEGFHTVGVNKTLTIEAGTTIEMQSGSTFRIDAGAGLIADGTTNPITFTGSTKQAGWWTGIEFTQNVNNANCQLKNCVIEYGGKGENENYGLVYVGAYSAPTISGCLLKDSMQSGIVFEADSDSSNVFNNTFENIGNGYNIYQQ